MSSVQDVAARSQVVDVAASDEDFKTVIRQASMQTDDASSETNVSRLSS